MGVSPRENSDNVFVHFIPAEIPIEVDIPMRDRQGPGLFWYHHMPRRCRKADARRHVRDRLDVLINIFLF